MLRTALLLCAITCTNGIKAIHPDVYHMAVFRQLDTYAKTGGTDTAVGREALKSIKRKVLNGTFPYLREHQR